MSSVMEQTLAFYIVLGVASGLTMHFVSKYSQRVMERRGFYGGVLLGVLLGGFIIFNSRLLADYAGSTPSEVIFLGIIVLLIVFGVIIWVYRRAVGKGVRTTARTTQRATRKVTERKR